MIEILETKTFLKHLDMIEILETKACFKTLGHD